MNIDERIEALLTISKLQENRLQMLERENQKIKAVIWIALQAWTNYDDNTNKKENK